MVGFDCRKACRRCVDAKDAEGMQRFGDSVLTAAKCVVGLMRFGELVSTAAKVVGGL